MLPLSSIGASIMATVPTLPNAATLGQALTSTFGAITATTVGIAEVVNGISSTGSMFNRYMQEQLEAQSKNRELRISAKVMDEKQKLVMKVAENHKTVLQFIENNGQEVYEKAKIDLENMQKELFGNTK